MSVLTDYYQAEDKERFAVLEELWEYAKSVEPGASEGLSYGLPALKLYNRPLIGFSMAKNHMSVYPFSPKIIDAVRPELKDFEVLKGVIRFTEDHVMPKQIIELLISLRREQLGPTTPNGKL